MCSGWMQTNCSSSSLAAKETGGNKDNNEWLNLSTKSNHSGATGSFGAGDEGDAPLNLSLKSGGDVKLGSASPGNSLQSLSSITAALGSSSSGGGGSGGKSSDRSGEFMLGCAMRRNRVVNVRRRAIDGQGALRAFYTFLISSDLMCLRVVCLSLYLSILSSSKGCGWCRRGWESTTAAATAAPAPAAGFEKSRVDRELLLQFAAESDSPHFFDGRGFRFRVAV